MKMSQNNLSNKNRVLMIGLDGGTLDLIRPWAEQGFLPHFQKIMTQGSWGSLLSVYPPISAPAWSSFATGNNPGKHGIFDHIYRTDNSYNFRPVNYSLRDGEAFWDILSHQGKKVGLINLPIDCSPRSINGFVVSGPLGVALGNRHFVYPPELEKKIKNAIKGYTSEPPRSVYFARGKEEEFLDDIIKMVKMREKLAFYLLENCDWDFFMVCFLATDIVQHNLWKFMDEAHSQYVSQATQKLRKGILSVYQEIDSFIGKIFKEKDDNTTLMIMSDHGHGPLEKQIYVNLWLLSKGLLKLKKRPATRLKQLLYSLGFTPRGLYNLVDFFKLRTITQQAAGMNKESRENLLSKIFLSFDDIDWTRTKAYSFGNIGPIYINLKSREPQGIVKPGQEYEALVKEIIEGLYKLEDSKTGEKIIERVYRSKDLYQGPYLAKAPDIFFIPKDLRYVAWGEYAFPSKRWVEDIIYMSGGHRVEGVFMALGPNIKRGFHLQGAEIIDLAPTVLATMGVPVPDDIDGKILKDVFIKDLPVVYQHQKEKIGSKKLGSRYSKEEEEEIKKRLRALGYIA
jgi:predicted AlkP superfamily phosphohydrolase/phosphomutase